MHRLGTLAALALLAACSQPVTSPSTHPGTQAPTSVAVLDPTKPILEVTVWATLEDRMLSWIGTRPGSDELWVADSRGELVALRGGEMVRSVLDMTGIVSTEGEQGLLGLAFHPGFEDNGLFYVSFTDVDGHNNVIELVLGGEDTVSEPGRPILFVSDGDDASNHPIHNIGALAFDSDGNLFVGMGDGGPPHGVRGTADDPFDLRGGIVRIRVDGDDYPDDPLNNYALPNIHAGDGGAPEIWAYGLRNPWRIWLEGDTAYIADVGELAMEEVNVVSVDPSVRLDFGWGRMEGTVCNGEADCDRTGTVEPVFTYKHDRSAGCSAVVGGLVYHGPATAIDGSFLFADFCDGRVWALASEGDPYVWDVDLAYPVAFAYGPDGEVLVASRHGGISRLDFRG